MGISAKLKLYPLRQLSYLLGFLNSWPDVPKRTWFHSPLDDLVERRGRGDERIRAGCQYWLWPPFSKNIWSPFWKCHHRIWWNGKAEDGAGGDDAGTNIDQPATQQTLNCVRSQGLHSCCRQSRKLQLFHSLPSPRVILTRVDIWRDQCNRRSSKILVNKNCFGNLPKVLVHITFDARNLCTWVFVGKKLTHRV